MFRLIELEPNKLRVEQSVKDPLTKKWTWVPLALVTGPRSWGEGHGALHQFQADFAAQMLERESLARRMEKAGG